MVWKCDGNQENSKHQKPNYKQISMTKLQNSKLSIRLGNCQINCILIHIIDMSLRVGPKDKAEAISQLFE